MNTENNHGNAEKMLGNSNAKKAEGKAESFLHVRIAPAQKAQYVKQANHEGLKLAEWVKKHLDHASEGAFDQSFALWTTKAPEFFLAFVVYG